MIDLSQAVMDYLVGRYLDGLPDIFGFVLSDELKQQIDSDKRSLHYKEKIK